ncbi:MAG: hypothetical protein IJW59_05185 [Clostridia bacterium]|nr:hypothetical protein [Clostridia bacterium]
MIKDGNYYFLNFNELKDQLVDVFREYYDNNPDIVEERIRNCGYVPYLDEAFIADYHCQYIALFKDDIVDAFLKKIGMKDAPQEVRDFVIDGTGKSKLLGAILEGDNVDGGFYLDQEYRKNRLLYKELASKYFGVDKDDLSALQGLARKLDDTMREFDNSCKSDVTRDIQRIEINRVNQLQAYLTSVAAEYVGVSDKDEDLLGKPEFDWIDAENLDSKYVLYGSAIDEPGLIASFTTQAEQAMNISLENRISILKNRLKYYVVQLNAENGMMLVSKQELFQGKKVKDQEDFAERLSAQIDAFEIACPDYVVTRDFADAIEELRAQYARDVYTGCRFAKNINRRINGYVHAIEGGEVEDFLTLMSYTAMNKDMPTNDIYFNESEYYDADSLLSNLIHEVNHAVSHGPAIPTEEKDVYEVRYGIRKLYTKLDKDAETMTKAFDKNESVMKVEENINERISKDILKKFLEKYPNPFEDSDFQFNGKKEFVCLYDYWNFLTEDFYQAFIEVIKEHRINSEYDMFFKEGVMPTGKIKTMMNYISKVYRRTFNKAEISKSGVVDYEKVVELGKLISAFETEIMPKLRELEIDLECFKNKGENFKTLPIKTRQRLEQISSSAKKIFDEILEDYKKYVEQRHKRELEENGISVENENLVEVEEEENAQLEQETQQLVEHIKNKVKFVEENSDDVEKQSGTDSGVVSEFELESEI